MKRLSRGDAYFLAANHVFFVLLALVMFYPLWYQITLSFSDPIRAQTGGAFLIPKGLSLVSYGAILKSRYIWSGYKSTIIVVCAGTSLSMAVTTLTGYGLSKKRLPGRRFLNIMVIFTMLFNGGIIPTYFVVKSVGILGTRWALFLPVLVFPFNVIVMRNFFQQIPQELEESAVIDGARDLRILLRIVLPLSKAAIATVTLWVMVYFWNDFFNCLLYINDRSKFVLQMILKEIISSSNPDSYVRMSEMDQAYVMPESVRAAAVMVVLIPILLVYPFLQKYFVKGIFLGSVKG